MKRKLSAAILEKYFRGDCTEKEIAEIDSWYQSFDQDSDDLSLLSADERDMFRTLMLNNIRENIKIATDDEVIEIKRGRSNRFLYYLIAGIAAVLMVFFFLPYKMPVAIPVQKEKVVKNLTNTILKIILPDSSKVWLSPKSQLTYSKKFAKDSRQVALDGEAFFEVIKDHKRPFSIHSGKVITKVWGTSFLIRSFKNDITRVDVVTGKVSVSIPTTLAVEKNVDAKADQRKEVMLTPNQEAVYDERLDNLKKNEEIKDASITRWKKVNISFDNTPMRDVFSILNKKFKVNIHSDDKEINADFLNADFTAESLPAIMEMMKKTLNVTYVVNGDEFILISNK